eukprot:5958500-Ditylum_brightwellii.AAC.1
MTWLMCPTNVNLLSCRKAIHSQSDILAPTDYKHAINIRYKIFDTVSVPFKAADLVSSCKAPQP